MSKMFKVDGQRVKTWNPLGGECGYHCPWCWARKLIEKKGWDKYRGESNLWSWNRNFTNGDIVFVQSMTDLFHPKVPQSHINAILQQLRRFPNSTFYLLTKNSPRYHKFEIPKNAICGCTIETNRDTIPYYDTPKRSTRIRALCTLSHRKFISIEPIMDFDLPIFPFIIKGIKPEFVYVGYDNYGNGLLEPSSEKTQSLINYLNDFTEVRRK